MNELFINRVLCNEEKSMMFLDKFIGGNGKKGPDMMPFRQVREEDSHPGIDDILMTLSRVVEEAEEESPLAPGDGPMGWLFFAQNLKDDYMNSRQRGSSIEPLDFAIHFIKSERGRGIIKDDLAKKLLAALSSFKKPTLH